MEDPGDLDQPVLRHGLTSLFGQGLGINSCDEAGNLADALQQVAAIRPQLAAISLPLENYIDAELIARLKTEHPPLKVLALVRQHDPIIIGRVLRSGADGCVHLGEPITRVMAALRTILDGGLFVGCGLARQLLNQTAQGKNRGMEALTDRERHVLIMIGQGLTTRDIAAKLDISPRTIDTHRRKLKLKLGLQNNIQLAHHAYREWHETAEGS